MMNGNGQGDGTGKEPVERVIDLFVHMPIGFALMAWKRVPALVVSMPDLVGQAVAKSCAQIAEAEERISEEMRKARMIGQVAVTFGGRQVRREVDARLADARRKAEGVASFVPGVGGESGSNGAGTRSDTAPVTATATPTAPSSPEPRPAGASTTPTAARPAPKTPAAQAARTGAATKPAATKAATKAATASKTAASKTPASKTRASKASGAAKASRATGGDKTGPHPAAKVDTSASAADLPIREYDGLSASQVVSRLTGLRPEELRAVRVYEDGSRGRRTVLLAIDRLLD
jgi:hypothetical protein